MPKKTCHGRRVTLLFLEPPGYQKVAKPAAHCPEVVEKLIYALLHIVIRTLQKNRKGIQQKE